MKKFVFILFSLISCFNLQARADWELLRYDIFESTCKQLMPQGYELFYLNDNDPKKHFVLTESQKRWTRSDENDFFRKKTFIVNHADKEIYVIQSIVRQPDDISTAVKAGQEKAQREYHERMKKTYKIEVDCANCANKMEEAANRTNGVKQATVNFMTLKMVVEFEADSDVKAVMQDVRKNCKKVEDDCEIYL